MPDSDQVSAPAERFIAPPSFELTYAFDDSDEPTEVTVFPADRDDVTTTWISIDFDHAVDLRDTA